MAYDNELAQKNYRKLKTALTRAINSKDPKKIHAEVLRFKNHYDNSPEPYPDFWSRWQRAADDACLADRSLTPIDI